MLQDPGVVGHGLDVAEVDCRQFGGTGGERGGVERGAQALLVLAAGALEALEIRLRDGGPQHGAAVRGGALAESGAFVRVVEQAHDLGGDGRRILPRHQHAAAVREELARVRIRRGDDRLARAERVGQRARGDLFRIQVGGDVDVGRGEKLRELRLANETVVENDVAVHSQPLGAILEHQAVGLALPLDDVRMRRAEHDVYGVGMLGQDGRKGVDDVLDPLVGREEPEGEDERPPFHAEAVLASGERHVRNPVRDDVDLLRGDAVDVAEELSSAGGHDHQAIGQRGDLIHHAPLVQVRRGENRVKRRYDRHPQLAQKREQMTAGLSAEDPVLVLHGDHVDGVHVEEIGRARVRAVVAVGELEADALRIIVLVPPVVHGQHEAVEIGARGGDRIAQIGGECGDAALARQVIAEQRNAPDGFFVGHGLPLGQQRSFTTADACSWSPSQQVM